MVLFWIKEVMSKDSTNFWWLHLIGFYDLQVTTRILSLEILEDISERTILDCKVLGRLMISSPLFVKKRVSLFILLYCLGVFYLFLESLVSTWSVNSR